MGRGGGGGEVTRSPPARVVESPRPGRARVWRRHDGSVSASAGAKRQAVQWPHPTLRGRSRRLYGVHLLQGISSDTLFTYTNVGMTCRILLDLVRLEERDFLFSTDACKCFVRRPWRQGSHGKNVLQ